MCVDLNHSPSTPSGSTTPAARENMEPAGDRSTPLCGICTRQETLEERRERTALVMLLERHSKLTQEELRAASNRSLQVLRMQVQMMRALNGEGYWGDSR